MRIYPRSEPRNRPDQKNNFLLRLAKTSDMAQKKKPEAECPLTKEQLESHWFAITKTFVNSLFPLNSIISLGRALPENSLNPLLISIPGLIIRKIRIKICDFLLIPINESVFFLYIKISPIAEIIPVTTENSGPT